MAAGGPTTDMRSETAVQRRTRKDTTKAQVHLADLTLQHEREQRELVARARPVVGAQPERIEDDWAGNSDPLKVMRKFSPSA